MKEAMEMVKKELGPDAVILSTKEVRKSSEDYGMLGRKVFEVVAAVDDGKEDIPRESPPEPMFFPTGEVRKIREMLERLMSDMNVGSLKAEIEELKREIKALKGEKGVFKGVREEIYQFLLGQGVKEVYARKIVERLPSHSVNKALGELSRLVKGFFVKGGPLKKVVFLVGPTGVGKTTTVAKLAARDLLERGKKVVLVTIDTYRIGAAEQLTTYAKILGIPIRVVSRVEEFYNVLHTFSSVDTIYVDTTGRSHKDAKSTMFVRDFVDAVGVKDVLLLVSANMDSDNAEEVIRSYSSLGVTGLIYTKIDETSKYGLIINSLVKFRYPIHFFTTGQRVPEDMEVGSGELLAKWLEEEFRKEYGYDYEWGPGRVA